METNHTYLSYIMLMIQGRSSTGTSGVITIIPVLVLFFIRIGVIIIHDETIVIAVPVAFLVVITIIR